MAIELIHISKSYHNQPVLNSISLKLREDKIYCLMAPSGAGKTTLLNILLGLVLPDSGDIQGMNEMHFTAVFQENRLCEAFSAVKNVRMVMPPKTSDATIAKELSKLLPVSCLHLPIFCLSGGMKRRTAICRAVLAPSDGIIMDEPFTGLDEDTKLHVIQYIKEQTNGKLLLIATHQKEDSELLGAEIIRLS